MSRRKKKDGTPEQGANPNPAEQESHQGENPDTDATGEASESNDLPWYTKLPRLMQDAASVVWAWVSGIVYNMQEGGGNKKTFTDDQFITPGFQVYYCRPNLPVTEYPSDTLNAVSMQEFVLLRSTVSSKLPYDAPELGLVNIAIANIYAFINFLARCYAIAFLIDNENRYTPKHMLTAMGVSWSSITEDLANFRYGVNLLIQRVATLAIPKEIAYLAREASLYASIYQDGTSVKDQMYFYSPESFFQYMDNVDGNGTPGLKLRPFWNMDGNLNGNNVPESKLWTAKTLLEYGNSLVSGLFNSEAVATICANTVRAFGENGVIRMNYLEENVRITPIFDIVVLEQMKNATVMPKDLNASATYGSPLLENWVLTQSVNSLEDPAWWLQFKPTVEVEAKDLAVDTDLGFALNTMLLYKKILTTTTGYTDASIVIESSRLMTMAKSDEAAGGPKRTYYFSGGAEIIMSAYAACLANYTPTGSGSNILNFTRLNSTAVLSTATTQASVNQALEMVRNMALKRSFRFAPGTVIKATPYNGNQPDLWKTNQMDFDIDNFALLTHSELDRLHDTCFYSMLMLPVANQVNYSNPKA